MSAIKRPRSPSFATNTTPVIIDLTSDDEDEAPPAKRQKSYPPTTQNLQHAKPTSAGTSSTTLARASTPQSNDLVKRQTPESSKAKPPASPWKNVPAWRKNYRSSSSASPIPSPPNELIEVQPSSQVGNRQASFVLQNGVSTRVNGVVHGPPRQAYRERVDPSAFDGRSNGIHSSSNKLTKFTVPVDHKPRDSTEAATSTSFRLPPTKPLRFDVVGNQQAVPPGPFVNKHQNDSKDSRRTTFIQNSVQTSRGGPSGSQHDVDLMRRHPNSDPKSVVEVKLPVRPSPTPSPANVQSKSGHVDRPRPSEAQQRTPHFIIDLPPTKQRLRQEERRAMQEKLKMSTDLAVNHPIEVERILGLTGFSDCFAPDSDEEKYKALAQPKKRNVDRKTIVLPLIGGRRRKGKERIKPNYDFVHPREQAKAVLTDRFGEIFNPPLTFSNEINDSRLNGKFQFISQYILRGKVKSAHISPQGCNCEGSCQIDCACLRKTFDDHFGKETVQVQSYVKRFDGRVVLTDSYIDKYSPRAEISECNDHCSCSRDCTNRVVQRGRTISLEIFQTARCGFGVRSSVDIVRGQFIELYLGEVITEHELSRREAAHEEGASSYIYSLDWFPAQNHYHIDGANFGTAMRYVNHCCDPNTRTFTVLNPEGSKSLHYVAFFAIKDIPRGEEITIDYSPQEAGKIYEDVSLEDEDVVECLCGAPTCRKRLWRPGKERRNRKKVVGRDE